METRAKKPGEIDALLTECLGRGGFRIGEIRVSGDPGRVVLQHVDDNPGDALDEFSSPRDALALALYDKAGKYRPLKTAPNLARGWRLVLAGVGDLRLALDAFYPAALGMWCDFLKEGIRPTPWSETVGRQSGMYRIVGKITDEQTEKLLGRTCEPRAGCLRAILWPLRPGCAHALQQSDRARLLERFAGGEIPLLCVEACNLVVAAGRPVVKEGRYPGDPGEASAGETEE